MSKLNNFFFLLEDGEELHPSDAVWFYGTFAVVIGIGLIVAFA